MLPNQHTAQPLASFFCLVIWASLKNSPASCLILPFKRGQCASKTTHSPASCLLLFGDMGISQKRPMCFETNAQHSLLLASFVWCYERLSKEASVLRNQRTAQPLACFFCLVLWASLKRGQCASKPTHSPASCLLLLFGDMGVSQKRPVCFETNTQPSLLLASFVWCYGRLSNEASVLRNQHTAQPLACFFCLVIWASLERGQCASKPTHSPASCLLPSFVS